MLSQPPEDKEKVSMPSLWRAKLLMAQKDRVAEGLQVGSPVLVSSFLAWLGSFQAPKWRGHKETIRNF